MCDKVSDLEAKANPGRAERTVGASLKGQRLLRLPNGLDIACQTATEARFLYRDIFERQAYLRHGVSLKGAQCVFDVGANIGLFTLFAGQRCPRAEIYSFEPAPPLFEILSFNVRLCGVRARLFECGIFSRPKSAELTFYPNSSGMSSIFADPEEEREALSALMANEWADGKAGMDEVMQHCGDLLDERLRSRLYKCRLLPLSDVIRRQGVQRIDLLKVDVQKSELDVIRGIEDEHWPLIRQISMEVHQEAEGLSDCLRRRGFEVAIEQDEHYRNSKMLHLFAVRPGPARTSALVAARPADDSQPSASRPAWELLLLSAASPSQLKQKSRRLGRFLSGNQECSLTDVALGSQVLDEQMQFRQALVCRNRQEAAEALQAQDARCLISKAENQAPDILLLFPGLGSRLAGVAAELYLSEPAFRRHLDQCAQILKPFLKKDLKDLLYPSEPAPDLGRGLRRMARGGSEQTSDPLARTELAQPVLFALEYSLACQWMAWGIRPQAMIGYSVGEYVAACLSGVFSLPDALELVARRAQMISQLPPGAMLAVPLGEEAVRSLLGGDLHVAAVNGSSACVVAGSPEAVGSLERKLQAEGMACRRLAAGHAFHSPLMSSVRQSFKSLVEGVRRSYPRIPYLSNVSGDWITDRQARDPEYWAEHLCQPVQYASSLAHALQRAPRMLLEVGPVQGLTAWALQACSHLDADYAACSLPHDFEEASSIASMLRALGKLWLKGVKVDWEALQAVRGQRGNRLPEQAVATLCEERRPPASQDPQPQDSPPEQGFGPRYAAPRNGIEARLCAIWQDILNLERIGIQDRFFEIGGDSLKAARLLSQLTEEFEVSLRLRHFFRVPTVAQLSVAIVEEQASGVDHDLMSQLLAEIQSAASLEEGAGPADQAPDSSAPEESQ